MASRDNGDVVSFLRVDRCSPRAGEERNSDRRTMGVVLTQSTSAEKNYRSRPSPQRRHASFHLLKDDGGGVNAGKRSRHQQRKYLSKSSPPGAERIV
jgi:hypothetical protein